MSSIIVNLQMSTCGRGSNYLPPCIKPLYPSYMKHLMSHSYTVWKPLCLIPTWNPCVPSYMKPLCPIPIWNPYAPPPPPPPPYMKPLCLLPIWNMKPLCPSLCEIMLPPCMKLLWPLPIWRLLYPSLYDASYAPPYMMPPMPPPYMMPPIPPPYMMPPIPLPIWNLLFPSLYDAS